MWLNILAVRKMSVPDILRDHWATYGRNFYSRHDYEAVPTEDADHMVSALRAALPTLPGTRVEGLTVEAADDYAYTDPVDGSVSKHQGIRVLFEGGARFVIRLSGTGTTGATVRLYLESLETVPAMFDQDPQKALAPIIRAAEHIAHLEKYTGKQHPDVTT